MSSPFPGMDPWLEDRGVFPDLHDRLSIYISEQLNSILPPGIVATTRNRIVVDDAQIRIPDVSVLAPEWGNDSVGGLSTLQGLNVIAEEVEAEVEKENYLEIRSEKGRKLITAIEILSRANKTQKHAARASYFEKRAEFFDGGVNFVEIDLLRYGEPTTRVPEKNLRLAVPDFSYHVAVTTGRPKRRLFSRAWRMQDPIPPFAIPLDKGQTVLLDLQPLLSRAYVTGRYTYLTDYSDPCDPPLTADQKGWADEILKAHLAKSIQTSS